VAEDGLPAELFQRVDESDDALFYSAPRLVAHVDEATIAALTRYYADVLPSDGRVLDLMSSWISHLPPRPFEHVAGLGMNQHELDANPRLDQRVVHDLNLDPTLPFVSSSFDAVLIAVSVQYLTRPIEVFREIARVLRREGRVIVAMSHRCFPTKAVRAFHLLSAADRVRLVATYIELAGGFDTPQFVDRSPPNSDPMWIVTALRAPVEPG
jgi:SAM-dependent methyltransferase